jgi:hypothetical protein
VPKDWEVGFGVIGDEFFSILPKFMDWDTLMGTLGDALRTAKEHLRNLNSRICKKSMKRGRKCGVWGEELVER